jgi:hypothetical protein
MEILINTKVNILPWLFFGILIHKKVITINIKESLLLGNIKGNVISRQISSKTKKKKC